MCGATSEQKELQRQQADFFREGIQQQKQVYGQDQEILKAMSSVYEPILQAGPNQHGFNDEQRNTLNTQVSEGTAQNYQHAADALGENVAAMGGGNDYLPTGADAQLKANLLSSAAQKQSSQQLEIKSADYAQGYDQWKQAGAGITNTAQLLNPTAFSGAATASGNAAGNTANQIAQENNSWVNAALGAAGAIGAGAMGNPAGLSNIWSGKP
jgi:hypothetical protein